jgi:hypothetical protein
LLKPICIVTAPASGEVAVGCMIATVEDWDGGGLWAHPGISIPALTQFMPDRQPQ